MSAAAIRAAKAWVELSLQDKTAGPLASAQKRFLNWGFGLAKIGGMITATAGSITAALTFAAATFNTMGSQALDMSQAAALSVEEFSALSYAAKQSGSSVEQLSAGMNALNRFTLQAKRGTQTAVEALGMLGIPVERFLAAKPVERLGMVADALATIEDDGLKAGLAMAIMGRSGTALMPMLAGGSKGLEELAQRAEHLGLIITEKEAQKAHALGDAWDDLRMVWDAIVFKTGAAVAETLTTIFLTMTELGAGIGNFIAANQFLVVSLATAAIVAMGVGAAFLTLAGASLILAAILHGVNAVVVIATALWAALGTVKTVLATINAFLATTLTAEGIAAAFAAVQVFLLSVATNVLTASVVALEAALGLLMTPLGLIVVTLAAVTLGLVLGAVMFFRYTEAGQQMLSNLGMGFAYFGQIALDTIRGIYDAITAGNWQLAGEVLMAGLNKAFQFGLSNLRIMWADFKLWLIQLLADLAVGMVESIADGLKSIIDVVNQARAKVGLDPIGTGGIDAVVGTARGAAGLVKGGAQASRDQAVSEAEKNFADAAAALAEAVRRAAAERQAGSDARKAKMLGLLDVLDVPGLEAAGGKGSASGSFNAAVASMISQTAEGAAEKTAANTGAMKDHLAAMRQKMEQGLLEVIE